MIQQSPVFHVWAKRNSCEEKILTLCQILQKHIKFPNMFGNVLWTFFLIPTPHVSQSWHNHSEAWSGSITELGCFSSAGPGALFKVEGIINISKYLSIWAENLHTINKSWKCGWVFPFLKTMKHISKLRKAWFYWKIIKDMIAQPEPPAWIKLNICGEEMAWQFDSHGAWTNITESRWAKVTDNPNRLGAVIKKCN